jgi:hypothetical protein
LKWAAWIKPSIVTRSETYFDRSGSPYAAAMQPGDDAAVLMKPTERTRVDNELRSQSQDRSEPDMNTDVNTREGKG